MHRWSRFTALFACAIFFVVFTASLLTAQTRQLQFPYQADLITYQEDTGQAVFNWDQFSIAQTPPFSEEVSTANGTYGVGTKLEEALTVGDFSIWGSEKLSIDRIANITGEDLKKLALTAYPHITNVTVSELVDTLGLSNYAPKEVRPILKLFEQVGGRIASNYINGAIADLLGDYPAFGEYSLNNLEAKVLENFDLESIPGADLAQLGQFSGWSNIRIQDVPGLANIPFSTFPEFTGPGVVPVAKVGVVHSQQEANSTIHVISGGGEAGYNIPCKQKHCSYIELDPVAGDRLGQRWNVGGKNKDKGEQQVKGGYGANPGVRAINGGKEPVGRPLGSDMQLVLKKVDQTQGQVTLQIYTRVCESNPFTGKTCSARAIPFIPLGTFNETDLIPVGAGRTDLPSQQPPQDISRARDKGESLRIEDQVNKIKTEDGTISVEDVPAPTPCSEALNKISHPDKVQLGYVAIPQILRYAKGFKLSQAQTAFALAYFEGRGYTDGFRSGIQKLYPSLKNSITSRNSDYYGIAAGLGTADPAGTAAKASQFNAGLSRCSASGGCSLSSRVLRPVKGTDTSAFGYRLHPILKRQRLHTGQDIGAPKGTVVVASDCGKVVAATFSGGYGNLVIIQHNKTYQTYYAHLNSISVKRGDVVNQGQPVGTVGSTGLSTGPHLHWEVRRNRAPINPYSVSSF